MTEKQCCEKSESDVWNNYNLFTTTSECTEEKTIEFQGKIPEWLKGNLYRNGPGLYEINNDPAMTFNHLFDGFAYIQKYSLDGPSQTVRFRGSFVKSRTYNESTKNGRLMTRQFGTDPCKSIFGRFQSFFYGRDAATTTDDTGVTVQMVHNQLLALTEVPVGNVLDPDTLEPVGPLVTLPYGRPKDSTIMSTTTAHVMYDAKRKMTVGYSSRATKNGNFIDVVFIPEEPEEEETKEDENDHIDKLFESDRRFVHLTTNINERAKKYNHCIKKTTKAFRFPSNHTCYMHSASISENYLILSEIPLHFDKLYGLWFLMFGGIAASAFKWQGDTLPTYFRVISLDTGEQVAYIPGPAFFHFHHVNSYECEENKRKINVDICAFDDHRIIDELHLNKLRENVFPSGGGYIRRFELDLDGNTCTEPNANAREPKGNHCFSYSHSLVPVQFELPRINPNYIGKPYRYVYGDRAVPGRLFDALIKLDLETKQEVNKWEEPFTSPSEPIFVPNPNGPSGEDDGVVLSVVLDQKAKRSFLLVLDGTSFKEVARAYLPVHIPASFHGNFY